MTITFQVLCIFFIVPITSVCFSKDNNTILISSLDNSIRLLDKSTGNVLNEYIGHENEKYKIDSCFAMNDSMIVTGSEDSIIYFYDLIDSKIFHTLQGHKQPVTSISMHPHEPTMVTASVDGTIHLWQNKL